MAKGPRYRRPLRRRVEEKTNYHKRLKLIKSKKLRAAIRASSNHITVQVIKSKLEGDEILASSHSRELLLNYDWKANTGNLPASYLTGYLAGLRAKKAGISEAILDLGIFYHRNRILAAFKGLLDAGIEIPHKDEFFPESLEGRVDGSHIEDYAKLLKKEDPEKYEQVFSGYLSTKVNPTKFTQIFSNSLKKIENNA
ncbi:MAG: 50S ribosomal protein L18 [Candidatus Lokiarchaeota archaeon]|nr:50S ribosomal protein L18 [Candidatus Lokiarchaeota archaeon]MBD3200769.1 50S ribosomal protein L18 [Candidatus Lokiarchaeota archaeon]